MNLHRGVTAITNTRCNVQSSENFIFSVLERKQIHLMCEAGSHDFMSHVGQSLVLLWQLNMTEQIFRTHAYFINIFSIQIPGHRTSFSPWSFPANFQFLSYILLLQMPQHFLCCPEKHHHNHTDKFIYLLKAISTHSGDSVWSHRCFLFTETLFSKATETYRNI